MKNIYLENRLKSKIGEMAGNLRHWVFSVRYYTNQIQTKNIGYKELYNSEQKVKKLEEELEILRKMLKECEDGGNNEVIDRVYRTRYDCPKVVGSAHRDHALILPNKKRRCLNEKITLPIWA